MTEAWDEFPDGVQGMRRRMLYEAFSPSAPIDRAEVFAGRQDQLAALREVMFQRGQHAVIYGERGVGKTSLARVSRDVAMMERMFTAHVTCDGTDTFRTIWRKVFEEIVLRDDGADNPRTALRYLEDDDELGPNEVRIVFRSLTVETPAVVFIDEFDIVRDEDARRSMAETIKVLSDQGISATIVIVGVADSVVDLISQHASTERNLIQVPMPRMPMDERLEIIKKGLAKADMTIDDAASQRIAFLSQGLPQFVHLLAQRSAFAAVGDDRDRVVGEDVGAAIEIAIKDTHVSVSSAYYTAVRANRETLYPAIMCACALAVPDERGFFTAKALVEPLSQIMGKEYGIPTFGPHLNRLASTRGPVLVKEGESRKFRYRFVNPLMQPFTLMKGLQESLIDYDLIRKD